VVPDRRVRDFLLFAFDFPEWVKESVGRRFELDAISSYYHPKVVVDSPPILLIITRRQQQSRC
jgi:hypothetical protein